MYNTILVPVDGSNDAAAAITRAASIARATDATVHALFVTETAEAVSLESGVEDSLGELTADRAQEALATAAERARTFDLDVVRATRDGIVHEEIADYVAAVDADLVAMGTRGRGGDGMRRAGSTTERVITLVDVPVLSVSPGGSEWGGEGRAAGEPSGPTRILLPTDGSDVGERAAGHALDLAAVFGATVHAVYVLDDTVHALEDAPRSIIGLLREGGQRAVEDVADEARDRELPVTTAVLRGDPADELLSYAAGVEADLLAMGTRGRGAGSADDRLLGSTTARVLGRSNRPVLTLR